MTRSRENLGGRRIACDATSKKAAANRITYGVIQRSIDRNPSRESERGGTVEAEEELARRTIYREPRDGAHISGLQDRAN